MSAQVQIADQTITRYATATDYYSIFAGEMDSLYFLAFLLTAAKDKAERCFVGGLEKCIDRTSVPMEQAYSMARRAIVKDAIRMIRPVPEPSENGFFAGPESPAT